MPRPRIGVLALQGAFREHCNSLARCHADAVEVRRAWDLDGLQGLIIPGGESTTMGKLLHEWDLFTPILERGQAGMPIYGSCAGLILLCSDIENFTQPHFGLLHATVQRNAFGRQKDSFETPLHIPALGTPPLQAVFIRAPVISHVGPDVQILAKVHDKIVAVRQKNILASSFHPELTPDTRWHEYFLGML